MKQKKREKEAEKHLLQLADNSEKHPESKPSELLHKLSSANAHSSISSDSKTFSANCSHLENSTFSGGHYSNAPSSMTSVMVKTEMNRTMWKDDDHSSAVRFWLDGALSLSARLTKRFKLSLGAWKWNPSKVTKQKNGSWIVEL